ncbi:MAG: flippase-like domain-containing protein [Ilumatobacter sp.]|nr:flippase-like domain-containing protein [Ilumatobacter sp.]
MSTEAERETTLVDGVRLFGPPPALRRFSPADVIRVMFGVLTLAAAVVANRVAKGTIDGVEEDVVDGLTRLPESIEQIGIATAQLFATLVPLFAFGAIIWKRRWRVLLHVWLGSFIAGILLEPIVDLLGDRGASEVLFTRADESDSLVAADFPTTSYLASAVGAVTVGAPYLPRRWRRAAWFWIAVLVVLRFLGPGQPPLDILIAVAVGTIIGSLILLVLGSPSAEPSPTNVLAGVRSIGLQPVRIGRLDATAGSAGSVHYVATDADAIRTFIKMRTPDDQSWDLLNRTYRAVRLRSSEVRRPFSTLKRRVEHEALALRTVTDNGVAAPQLVGLGVTPDGGVLLAEELIHGRQLAELDPDEVSNTIIASVFREVRKVHDTRTAHHHLTLDNFMVEPNGRVRILDFDDAELAAEERDLSRDIAEVMVAIGTIVGPQRTVSAAIDAFGEDRVNGSLPLLQPLALSASLGREAKRQRGLLDALRAEIHERTDVDDVPLEKLARIQPKTLIMIMAGALAFYSLLPQFGNLDDTVDAFGDARWQWIPALLGAAAVYYVFATISFLGSVAQRMPIAPSARSQVATSFAQLVGPAGAGKMALAGRFLQRNGLTGAEASASVALNTMAGVVTHLTLMVGFFAWAGGADIGGFSLPSVGTVLLVAAAALVLLGIAVAIPYTRTRLIMPVVSGLRTAAGYTGQVVKSPARVAGLLGGSTCITLTYLVGAVFAVEAFGGGIGFAEIGAAYLGAAAIANIAPTPGGIGPLEAAMIAGFTGFGLDGGVAISAVLTFRLATFWLPILPGWITFMWMERRGEI